MVTNVCVLRSGGDYKPEHVTRLAQMVPDLVCLSDMRVSIPVIELEYDWPGWWSKMHICGPWIEGDVFYLDLDTTVYSMPKMPDRTTVLRDFGNDARAIGSGLMYLTQEDRAKVWEEFTKDPAGAMAANRRWPNYGDQGFFNRHLKRPQKWQDIAKVYSYKEHCLNGVPEDAEIVCHHGRPRPWEV